MFPEVVAAVGKGAGLLLLPRDEVCLDSMRGGLTGVAEEVAETGVYRVTSTGSGERFRLKHPVRT